VELYRRRLAADPNNRVEMLDTAEFQSLVEVLRDATPAPPVPTFTQNVFYKKDHLKRCPVVALLLDHILKAAKRKICVLVYNLTDARARLFLELLQLYCYDPQWKMELRHLKYFVVVAEELSFTKAAARLRISQPPLTAQIRTLEEELELQLFNRTKHKVELTRAGEVFLAEARLTLSQAQRTRKLASQLASGSIGEVRVGFTHSAALNPAIPRILYNFRTQNPAINLVLKEMLTFRQLECLSGNELDVGFCRELTSVVPPSGVTIERIMQERLLVVLNSQHKLAKQSAVLLKTCADEPFVFLPSEISVGLSEKVRDLCDKAGFKPRIVQEANGVISIVGLVASGIGISILPESVKSIAYEGVVYRPLRHPDAVIPLTLVFRESEHTAAVSRFLAHVRKAVGSQA